MSFVEKALTSSKKQEWTTPPLLYEALDSIFHFNFDPCPTNPNFDGLSIDWGNSNFVNPPYNQVSKWAKKGFEEWKKQKRLFF